MRARQSGVTLVELIIVVAILAIFMGLAAPYMTEWVVNNRIRTAAESVANGLRLAKAEAVRRNQNVEFRLTTAGRPDWSVAVVSPSTAVQSSPAEGVGGAITVAVAPASTLVVQYNGLGRMVPPGGTGALLTQIDVDSTELTAAKRRNLRITLTAGGGLRMCDPDPALPATNARKC